MILGKSNHPVLVKRIHLNCWSLRDEIEQALTDLYIIKETLDENEYQKKLNEIKSFYRKGPKYFSSSTNIESEQGNEDEMLRPEVGEVDDEMAAMAAALDAGDDSDDNEAKSELSNEQEAEIHQTAQELLDQSQATNLSKPIQIKRAKPEKKLSTGLTFLNDINMDEIVFFSRHGYQYGQSIVLEFLIPQKFILSAEVVVIKEFALNSKVISDRKPDFRVRAKFTFIHDGERTNLRNFLKSIEPEIPPPPKKPKTDSESTNKEDDDLSDFGF